MKINKNDIKILELIQRKEVSSRVEIANKIGISQAAVSKKVKQLIEDGYIKENHSKNKKTAGRNSVGLEINPDLGKVLGIYLAPEEISIVLSDLEGNLLKLEKEKIENHREIKKLCFKLIEKYVSKNKIINIGIAVNGIVDVQHGISVYSAAYGWSNVDIKSEIEKKFGISVFVENGMNLMALYEKTFGLCKEKRSFVVINIGSGVGAGVYLDNKIYHGKDFGVGEIGHIPFDLSKEARICSCGNKGCIETILSDWRVEEQVAKLTGTKYSYDEIVEKANNGESYFQEIFIDLIPVFLNIIFWITTLINPEELVIYGKINKCGDFFWRELKRRVKEGNLNKNNILTIKTARFDSDVIVHGAVIYALETLVKAIKIEKS